MKHLHEHELMLRNAWRLLRITYGLFFIVGGLDKFFNIVTIWPYYYSPFILKTFGISSKTVSIISAVIEIGIGMLFFITPWVRYAAYAALLWIAVVIGNLLTSGTYYDIIVRDLIIALSIYAFERLTAYIFRTRLPIPSSEQYSA